MCVDHPAKRDPKHGRASGAKDPKLDAEREQSGIPLGLRCEGPTPRERQASDFGAALRRKGCAPGSPPRPSAFEAFLGAAEAGGQGEPRSGAPIKLLAKNLLTFIK